MTISKNVPIGNSINKLYLIHFLLFLSSYKFDTTTLKDENFQKSCKQFKDEDQSLTLVGCDTDIDFVERLSNLISRKQNLSSLVIKDTELRKIPVVICNLIKLQSIQLINNGIDELPDDCINNLSNIEVIQISKNLIKRLENGVFDGLTNLKQLVLDNNRIDFIGTNVFTNMSSLLKLWKISLVRNELTSVDPWPIMRGINLNDTEINLKENKINKFTNNLNWYYNCNMRKNNDGYVFKYIINNNQIERLNDFLQSCFKQEIDFICLSGSKFHSTVSIHLDDGNPFICDCIDHMYWPRLAQLGRIGFMNKARCSKPVSMANRYWASVKPNELECNVTNMSCIEGCTCIKQAKEYFHITCSSLKTLPMMLPLRNVTSKYNPPYKLSFAGSSISTIADKDYFKDVAWLDLSRNALESITLAALKSILQINTVRLHANKLTTLPQYSGNVTTKFLSLHNNDWDCNCDKVWFKYWLETLKDDGILTEPDSIHCKVPSWLNSKNIFKIDDHDFCENPNKATTKKYLLIIMLPLMCLIVFFIIIFVVVRRCKVQLNAYFNIHPLDKDECLGENMEFDGFISCAYTDRELGIYLIKLLESKGYQICYHEKDFIGGLPIVENIKNAINVSKRVICILSNEFLKSSYCVLEFQMALDRNIRLKKNRLIIILDKSVDISTNTMPGELCNFLRTHTYIENDYSAAFVNHLLYSMPIKKLGTSIVVNSSFKYAAYRK